LILKLLQAWKEPLSHFNQHIEHHQELSDDSISKAKQISNMVHELKTGVEKVTQKVRFSMYLLLIPVKWREWLGGGGWGGDVCSPLGCSLHTNRGSDPAALGFVTDTGIFQPKDVTLFMDWQICRWRYVCSYV